MAPDEIYRLVVDDPSHCRISALVIEERDGTWSVRMTYAGMGRVHPDEVGKRVDLSQIPEQVAVQAYEADPDRRVELPSAATPESITAALDYLHNDGILGNLNILRVRGRWHVGTHWGSTEERAAWLRGVREAGRV